MYHLPPGISRRQHSIVREIQLKPKSENKNNNKRKKNTKTGDNENFIL